jgi:hypothetical protein
MEMIVLTNFQVGVLSDKTLIRDLSHVILAHDHFARDAAGRLFRYDGGVYTENAELYVRRQVKQLTVTLANAARRTGFASYGLDSQSKAQTS